MPTYEYECRTCGTVMEEFQQITAEAHKEMACTSCGSVQPVVRLIGTGASLIFKGSGFYQTDYRSQGYKQAAKAESPGKEGTTDSGGKDAGKADKPAGESKSTSASTPATAESKPAAPAKSDANG